MPCIEGMEAKHVEGLVGQVWLHNFGDVAVVTKGHVYIFEAAVRLVDSVLRLILVNVSVGIAGEVFGKHNLIRPGASNWKGIAHYAPLWFAVQAKTLPKVVDEAHQHHPPRMSIATNRFGGL